jgi:putative hemolysin
VGLDLAIVAACLLVNALLAGSEIAFVSLRDTQLSRIEQRGERGRVLAGLARDPTRFLTTIQLGITLAGLLASASVAQEAADRLEGPLGFLGAAARPVAFALVLLVLTFLTMVVGELAPKRLAMQRAEGWGLLAARPIAALDAIARPVVWLVGKSVDVVVRVLGGNPLARSEDVTEEEVRDLIATSVEDEEQRTILSGAFEAAERTLREIVVPRSQVVALPVDAPTTQARAELVGAGHSRAPVFEGDLDDVRGVVHLIDLVDEEGPVAAHMRPATVIPEAVSVLDALRRLRTDRQQMAVVVNEHGATEGIVTVEDLLEEIVGDLYDEFDPDLGTVEHWCCPATTRCTTSPTSGCRSPRAPTPPWPGGPWPASVTSPRATSGWRPTAGASRCSRSRSGPSSGCGCARSPVARPRSPRRTTDVWVCCCVSGTHQHTQTVKRRGSG